MERTCLDMLDSVNEKQGIYVDRKDHVRVKLQCVGKLVLDDAGGGDEKRQ